MVPKLLLLILILHSINGQKESTQPSLWELILSPPLRKPINDSNGLTTLAKLRRSNFHPKQSFSSTTTNKVGNAFHAFTSHQGIRSGKRRRVLIDPSYTLGCTREGYFPVEGSCFHFLRCRQGPSHSIGYRGSIYRCPRGFLFNSQVSSHQRSPRCLPHRGGEDTMSPQCKRNTNDDGLGSNAFGASSQKKLV